MKNITTFLLVFVSTLLFSQTDEIQKIIPLSPNAAAFVKYGEIPVSNFTGTANVSVPIYTIKTKEFTLPLELSYHTGGNKVEEVASWVGLGWSLSNIPMISRSVRGIADEISGGYMSKYMGYTAENLILHLSENDIKKINFKDALRSGTADSEPDVFFFNINGKSGKFVFDQNTGKFVTLEESQIKISYNNNNGFFTIITEDGYEYLFSEKEIAYSNNEENTTGWYVSSISSPNKNENLIFEYNLEQQTLKTLAPKTKLLYLSGTMEDTNLLTNGSVTVINTVHSQLLKKITFDGGFIELNSDNSERLDLQGGHSLKNIKIKNINENLIFNYDFEYKYITQGACYGNETYTNKWMLLENLKSTASSMQPISYFFYYDESSIPPCRNSPAQDYWGYYNGATDNENLIPTVVSPNSSNPIKGANRSVNPGRSQFAILKKIVYPTGGYTEFDFENNDSFSNELPTSNVTDESATIDGSTTVGLEYYYETSFTINNPPDMLLNGNNPKGGSFAQFAMGCGGCGIKNGIANANVNFSLTREATASSPSETFYISRIFNGYLQNGNYNLVASINLTSEEGANLKDFFVSVVWKKRIPNSNRNRYVGGLRVREIRNYSVNSDIPIVKKYKYKQDYNSDLSSGKVFNEPSFVFEDDIVLGTGDCSNGTCAGVYRRLKSYSNIQQVTFSGSSIGYETVIEESNDPKQTGVAIYKYTHSVDVVDNRFPYPSPTSMELYRGQPKEISFFNKNDQGELILVKKQEFEYNAELNNSQRSIFKNISAFKLGQFGYYFLDVDLASVKFDNTHALATYEIATGLNLLSSEKTTLYSDNGNLITLKTYNYNSPIHFLLTNETFGSSTSASLLTKYFYPQDSEMMLKPNINNLVAKNIINKPLVTQTFNDNSKLSEQETKFGLFGNLLLPQFIYSGKNLTTDKKITYDKYDNKGNILQYTPEAGTTVSIIWGYNKTQPIAKIENATNSEIALALGVTDLNNINEYNLTAINNLRVVLPNTMVTTYTHIPLIGVSTITDVKGISTYYEYDVFGRLSLVKDQNLNILQRYCYSYKGQMVNCDSDNPYVFVYKSVAMSNSFTKNNCTSGTVGSSVVYSQNVGAVTSTVSQADADAKGLARFEADGQANANTNGTCTTPLPAAPTGLTFTIATATSLNFSWTPVLGATSYKIYKNGSDTGITSSTNTGSLSGLTPSTAYSIQVLAVNASGNSALSTAVSMTTAATPVSNSCTLNFERESGTSYMYKNGSRYLTRSTSGTSSGTLAAGDTFYVTVSASSTYYKGIVISSSVRGSLYNTLIRTGSSVTSPTFTKTGSEVITIDCITTTMP
ncbi:DUF5977 domain-containing protein [Flavobacterium salmonis]|uniref:Fibronectin type-III domain-containing protein n=1 Tax=Flavobacterium salmonis TaxID=2654844 RepID=A0A6V6YPP9_9FLAO|nr:DUF5977 domain-containing protein [Flavobacterium salmonis]CAD0001356.1 hypothetical protein FLAT13_00503 [Flavobacterium salmonis]